MKKMIDISGMENQEANTLFMSGDIHSQHTG